MGRRGPKPEPAVIKNRKGNPGHRPMGMDSTVPAALSSSVVAPVWLKASKRTKAGGLDVWNRLAPRLVSLKLLTLADTETFARYCRNFARWLDMNALIDKEDCFYEIETASGKVRRAHPAFIVADRLERQLLAAEDRFGLNPAERQRLFAARAQTGDPAARDLFGGDDKRPNDPAAKPTAPAEPSENPVGFLN